MSNARELAELGGALAGGGGIGMRNRIINGDMRVDQRNSGALVSAASMSSGAYVTDRFAASFSGAGQMTGQQVTDAPSGFSHSLKLTVTTADSSLTGSDYYAMRTTIEGYNLAGLAWGTSSAKSATLSFWVKASATGTYGARIINSGGARVFSGQYTISAANTWEYKTITIPANTSGTWAADNTNGAEITFQVACGPNYGGATANQWNNVTSYLNSVATPVNSMISTVGATWQITGIQFEAGTTATDFEFRHYTLEEMLCRRYYYRLRAASAYANAGVGRAYSATNGQCVVALPVSMRAAPTGGYSALTDWNAAQNSGNITALSPAAQFSLDYRQMTIDITCTTTLGNILILNANNTTNAWIDWSAEL